MTPSHCAGHRKSKVELSNGPHASPSWPQPLFASQYVDVQPMKESAGVWNDCARAKKAKPIMYAATKMTNSQGEVSGFVVLMIVVSMGATMCVPPTLTLISSNGDGAVRLKVRHFARPCTRT